MTFAQQQAILYDLSPVCDTGDPEAILEATRSHFDSMATARSMFCVQDEKYLKDFLPPARDFDGQGFLWSLLKSRNIMLVKNQGEGTDFRFTYTISLDTQFPSFLRARALGRTISGQDQALTSSLRFLAPHRSGIDIIPYLYENSLRISDPRVIETIEAYIKFIKAEEEPLLREGRIECLVPETEIQESLSSILETLRGDEWQVLAEDARKNWAIAYIVLLFASSIQISHPSKSVSYKMNLLLDLIETSMGPYPQHELHFAHTLFDRGSQTTFFRFVQPGPPEKLLSKLKNMAWDLSFTRTILNNVLGVARGNKEHADFVAPYMFTFDRSLSVLLQGWQANGVISFLNQGAKALVIYPMAANLAVSDSLQQNAERFDEERKNQRLEKGRPFHSDGVHRQRIVEDTEAYFLSRLRP